jgi:putative PIN family toxin of toxin-antitoxin system
MLEPTRAVFDCNTLLQALAAPHGPAGRCVQAAFDAKVQLFISPVVIEELIDVASRPKVARKLRITLDRLQQFIQALQIAATAITTIPPLFEYARDPDDAHYVNLALAANARLIVSRDNDLLDLMTADFPEAQDFRHRFPTLEVLTPVQFLQQLPAS